MRVDIYSHSFMVSDVSERQRIAVEKFARTLIQYDWVVEEGQKRWKAVKAFAFANADRSYYRFHINLLDEFKKSIAYNQIMAREIETIEHTPKLTDAMAVEWEVLDLPEPRDPQPAIIKHILEDGHNKIVTLQTGKGKLAADDSLVRVPGGWCLNGSIRPGDEIIARDGTITRVLQIHPQKAVQLYAVIFEDGRSLEVCLDHLWGVVIDGAYCVKNTAEILRQMEQSSRVSVPLVVPDNGDGILRTSDPVFVGSNIENLEEEERNSWLEAPAEQRRLYFVGVEVSRSENGVFNFLNDEALADHVVKLIRSLGGVAQKEVRQVQDRIEPTYYVEYTFDETALSIVSIEPSRIGDATCLTIEHHEALYVAQDFIVTHNTHLTKCVAKTLGVRSVFFMKGGFIDRWVPDMEKSFRFRKGELLVVRGSVALNAVMEMALDGELNAKVLFISINTFTEYLKHYEEHGVSSLYPIEPGEFYERMNIGFGALDEGHQNAHQVMRLFSYMHINKFVTLSATLNTMDRFMTFIYGIMYPMAERFNAGYYDVYIRVVAIQYQILKPKAIRYTGFGGAYSHTTFENSLMTRKNKNELKNYFDLISFYVKSKFVDVMQKGQKMIVFCATINLCTALTKHLQKLFPHLKVARYVSKDKMSVLDEAEIIVSTVLSAGTAVDIPNLLLSIMTTAIDSQQSNEQTLGRTRRLKDFPDITPHFFYFVCTSIEKHLIYSRHKEEFFRGKVLSHSKEQAPISV